MTLFDSAARERIRELNDAFRKTLDPTKGIPVLTAGVASLPSAVQATAIRKVATFDDFTEETNATGGSGCTDMSVPRFIEIDGRRYLWRDLLRLRREQRQAAKTAQLALFPLKEDRRPQTQKSA